MSEDPSAREVPPAARFLTVEQTARELAVSANMVRGMLRTGELRGIQIGGRHIWRIGRQDVEDFIAEAYRRTREQVESGSLPEAEEDADTE